MKKTLAVLSLVLICTSVHALEIDPFKRPMPTNTGEMNAAQVVCRFIEVFFMLFCSFYFLQLGRARTERYLQARKKLADKVSFLGKPKVWYGLSVAMFAFIVLRIGETIHAIYGPF